MICCAKLDNMLNYVDFIEERSPIIMKDYRERLENKVKELLEDKQIDERENCHRGDDFCR